MREIFIFAAAAMTGEMCRQHFVECKFFGGGGYEVFEAFDKAMHELYRNVLSIQPQDLYIKYEVIYGWGEPAKIFKI